MDEKRFPGGTAGQAGQIGQLGPYPPGQGGGVPSPPEGKIGKKDLDRARGILEKYRQGKVNLESRIVEDELWWELRHWEAVGRPRQGASTEELRAAVSPTGQVHGGPGYGGEQGPKPSSAWLFNAILNKHADAMDNYPEAVVLPREPSDEGSARTLSSVLPVVMEYNDFEKTYSDNWWEKLKHGTAVYGVFWNSGKENGLGDIDIVGIDLLRIFWEPGVQDIQKSRNLFIVELEDREALAARYPQLRELRDAREGGAAELRHYLYDDSVDTTDKTMVVDWYYKLRGPDGAPRLHYVKFCGDCLIYASENDPAYRDRGFYDHGLYPVVFDVLFPEKGTPAGFGYVAVCKNPQIYVDAISANILENSVATTKKRFFVSSSTGINESEFLDTRQSVVHVEGEIDEARVKEIVTQPLSPVYLDVMQLKIDEMKDTAANRDVNSGGATGSVTAAAAIAALQEAGNKASRDMISASYRAHTEISSLCLELMRQFYDERRAFRITGPDGALSFVDFSNRGIREQPQGLGAGGEPLYRRPVFDLKVRAQRSNPFSRMEQNARATELFGMGFFNPDRAQEVMGALDMMDFEGIDKVRERVQEGATLQNQLRDAMALVQRMGAALGLTPEGGSAAGADPAGTGPANPAAPGASGGGAPGNGGSGGSFGGKNSDSGGVMASQTARTGYQQRLAERSKPNPEG